MFTQNAFGQASGYPTSGNTGPFVTVAETATAYIYSLAVPGVKPEEIEIILQGEYLTVRGKFNPMGQLAESELLQVQSELAYGPFQRTFMVPSNVILEGVEATQVEGILEIILPKKGGDSSKKIFVSKVTSSTSRGTTSRKQTS